MGTAPPSTSKAGVVSAASKATTTTTPAPLAIPPLTAPSSGAATPATVDAEAPNVDAAAKADEIAFDEASHQQDGGDRSSSNAMLIIGIGLAAAVLGAGGWGWYHRSSRYQPA